MPLFWSAVPINAIVQTAECELVYSIDAKVKVRELFQMVCNSLGLRESYYFGLCRPPKSTSSIPESPVERNGNNNNNLNSHEVHHSAANSSSSTNQGLHSKTNSQNLLQNCQHTDLSDVRWLNPSKRLCDYSFISQEIAKQKRAQGKLTKSVSVQNLFFASSEAKKAGDGDGGKSKKNGGAGAAAKQIPTIRLDFRVRFYPENIDSEIVYGITQRLFFLQIRDQVLKGSLNCSPEDAVALAALSCQTEHGDWEAIARQFVNPRDGTTLDTLRVYNFLTCNGKVRLVSERVEKNIHAHTALEFSHVGISQDKHTGSGSSQSSHNMQLKEDVRKKLISHILERYTALNGILPDEAITNYLKVAQNLDSYGYSYWAVSSEFEPGRIPSDAQGNVLSGAGLFNNQDHNTLKSNTLKPQSTSVAQQGAAALSQSLTALHAMKLKQGEKLPAQYWFGVSQKGISIYEMGDHERAHPVETWPWPRLHQTEISGRKIILKIIKPSINQTLHQTRGGGAVIGGNLTTSRFNGYQGDEPATLTRKGKTEIRTFYVQNSQYCQAILEACRGNHELFVERRRVDSGEQQRLRMCASDEANARRIERQALMRERAQKQQLQNLNMELDLKYQASTRDVHELKIQEVKLHEAVAAYKQKAEMLEQESTLLHEKIGRMKAENDLYKNRYSSLVEENRHLNDRVVTMDRQWREAMEHQVSQSAYRHLFANNITNSNGNLYANGGMGQDMNGNMPPGIYSTAPPQHASTQMIPNSGIGILDTIHLTNGSIDPGLAVTTINNLVENNTPIGSTGILNAGNSSVAPLGKLANGPSDLGLDRDGLDYTKEYEYESGASTIGRIDEYSTSRSNSITPDDMRRLRARAPQSPNRVQKTSDTDNLVQRLNYE